MPEVPGQNVGRSSWEMTRAHGRPALSSPRPTLLVGLAGCHTVGRGLSKTPPSSPLDPSGLFQLMSDKPTHNSSLTF